MNQKTPTTSTLESSRDNSKKTAEIIHKKNPNSITEKKRRLNPMNLKIDESSSEKNANTKNVKYKCKNLLSLQFESIHSKKKVKSEILYLTKFKGVPFLRCQWLNEKALSKIDAHIKTRINKFNSKYPNISHQNDLKNWDPESCKVDRIISCSETMSIQNPKKMTDLKNHASCLLLRVIRFLTNFSFEDLNYGTFYIELSKTNQKLGGNQVVDFSVIANRIYLNQYSSPDEFWTDLGKIFVFVDTLCKESHQNCELRLMNSRMKQITKILYDDWLNFSKICVDLSNDESRFQEISQIFKSFKEEQELLINSLLITEDFIQSARDFVKKYEKVLQLSFGRWDCSLNFVLNLLLKIETLTQESKNSIIENEKPTLNADNISNFARTNPESLNNEIVVENLEEDSNTIKCEISDKIDASVSMISITDTEEPNDNLSVSKSGKSNGELDPTEIVAFFPDIKAESEINIDNMSIDKLFVVFKDLLKKKVTALECLVDSQFFKIESAEKIKKSFLCNFTATNAKWLKPIYSEISVFKQSEIMYLVKWRNQSYVESSWEKEVSIPDGSQHVRDFRRFSKTLSSETRKKIQSRTASFISLQNTLNNPKVMEKMSTSTLNELNKSVFFQPKSLKRTIFSQKSQPIYKGQRLLKSYQLESLNWMISAWYEQRNIILADEMGLGKTIQAMSFINYLCVNENLPGPYLVIAPLSTLEHWKRVFDDWTNLNAILYYDSQGKNGRSFCQDFEFYHQEINQNGFAVSTDICKFTVLITSYEVFAVDFESVFMKIPFQHIIIDEAHRLKNSTTKTTNQMKRHACKKIFLLTGTPIQNNLTELWCLLNFIEPIQFADLSKFLERFEMGMHLESIQNLQKVLAPYLLRRMKESVEDSIPPLTETIIDIELTNIQKVVYKSLYEKNKGLLQKGTGISCPSAFSNLEMQLRKCCNHPFILTEIKDSLTSDCFDNEAYLEKLLQSSGKMLFLDKIVNRLQKERKKMLVFSQFTEILKLLEEYFRFKGVTSYKIDGNIKSKERQFSIDSFNEASNTAFEVFLLSTKAGGVGINLVSAKTVIIFDSDWNPQNDVQAIARAHRIGQTEEVKVYRLITKNTYESEMFERSSKKLGLDQAILLTNKTEYKILDNAPKLKPEEIETLLKKGILGLLSQNVEEDFVEDSSESENGDDHGNKKKMANLGGNHGFFKKNFNLDNGEEKISIEDPDFWKKVFYDKKNKIDDIEVAINDLRDNQNSTNLSQQKSVLLKLLEEVYKYLYEKIKNDGYCEIMEKKLSNMLNIIAKSDEFHEVIRNVASKTRVDFLKNSRRIVPMNERLLNSYFQKYNEGNSSLRISYEESIDDEIEESSEIGRKREKPSNYSKLDFPPDQSKRIKKDDRLSFCDYCSFRDNLVQCIGPCKKYMHLECADTDSTISALEQAHNNKQSSENFTCYFCANKIAKCFQCAQIGLISSSFQNINNSGQNENSHVELFKCGFCTKFYHFKCADFKFEQQEQICQRHFCLGCGEFALIQVQCILCPSSFHKKCVNQKMEVLGKKKVICWKHIQKNTDKAKYRESKVLSNKESSLGNEFKKQKIKTKMRTTFGPPRMNLVRLLDTVSFLCEQTG